MTEIYIKDFMKAIDYNVNDFSVFESDIFGKHIFSYKCWDKEKDQYSIGAIADIDSCVVYKIYAIDYVKEKGFRWIHPDYVKQHNSDPSYGEKIIDEFLLGNAEYIDLDVPEDILEKTKAIFNRQPYDDNVTLPLNFTERELLYLMKQAHLKDITFNQYLDMIFKLSLEDHNLYKENQNG